MRATAIFTSGLLLLGVAACGDDDDGDDASVAIVSPDDGATVSSPVTVEMRADGLDIEAAGDVRDGAGHFHVMVDVGCVDPGDTIPGDTEGYHHFGDGSRETELELPPGTHELCLQVGDGAHTALDVTDTVSITVEG